LTTTKS
jgi:ribonuclease HI